MPLKDTNGIANSEDPDRTAPRVAVCSGSALFAKICCPEYVEPVNMVIRKKEI